MAFLENRYVMKITTTLKNQRDLIFYWTLLCCSVPLLYYLSVVVNKNLSAKQVDVENDYNMFIWAVLMVVTYSLMILLSVLGILFKHSTGNPIGNTIFVIKTSLLFFIISCCVVSGSIWLQIRLDSNTLELFKPYDSLFQCFMYHIWFHIFISGLLLLAIVCMIIIYTLLILYTVCQTEFCKCCCYPQCIKENCRFCDNA